MRCSLDIFKTFCAIPNKFAHKVTIDKLYERLSIIGASFEFLLIILNLL